MWFEVLKLNFLQNSNQTDDLTQGLLFLNVDWSLSSPLLFCHQKVSQVTSQRWRCNLKCCNSMKRDRIVWQTRDTSAITLTGHFISYTLLAHTLFQGCAFRDLVLLCSLSQWLFAFPLPLDETVLCEPCRCLWCGENPARSEAKWMILRAASLTPTTTFTTVKVFELRHAVFTKTMWLDAYQYHVIGRLASR